MLRLLLFSVVLMVVTHCEVMLPWGDSTVPHYRTKVFTKSQLRVERDGIYSEVDYTNPIRIWEEEWEIPPHLSRLLAPRITHRLGYDWYGPADDSLRAAVVLIHGGAFLPLTGSKSDRSMEKLAYELAQRGYRVMSIDYRSMNALAPSFYKGGYVAAQDAKAALRYLANRSEALHVDPGALFVGGISAGAITALHAAYLDEDEAILDRTDKLDRIFGCLTCTPEDREVPYRLRGVINISGGVFDTDILANNNVPVLHFHGDRDDLVDANCAVPFAGVGRTYNRFCRLLGRMVRKRPALRRELEEARLARMCGSAELHRVLRAQGTPSEFHALPNEDHYFFTADNGTLTERGRTSIRYIADFLADQL